MLNLRFLFTSFVLGIISSFLVFGNEPLLIPKRDAHPNLAKRIQEWISQLENPKKMSQAQQNLIRIGIIAHPFLLDALNANKKNTPEVKEAKIRIIQILREIPSETCIVPLIRCLENPKESVEVRENVALALVVFSSQKARASLLENACNTNSDPRVYRACAEALCQLSGKEAIPFLISLLRHMDSKVNEKAHQRLCEITGRYTMPPDIVSWQKWWDDYKDILEE